MPKAEMKKREIGSVVIFDLFGPLSEKFGEAIRDELESDIQKGNYINVILNTQGVEASDELTLRKILVTMERPVRKAIFCDNDAFFKALSETYLSGSVPVCRSEEEIVNLFGAYLLEKGKRIGKKDRRRYPRIKIAIPVGINLTNPRGETIQTKAIVTNLSDGGIFAEYLDWRSADQVKDLGDIKNMNAKIIFRHPKTGNETTVQGRVIRLEENQNQVGIAVQYVKE